MVDVELIRYRKRLDRTRESELADRLDKTLKKLIKPADIRRSAKPIFYETNTRFNVEHWNRFGKTFVARNRRTGRIESWIKFDPKVKSDKNEQKLKDRLFSNLEEKNLLRLRKKIPDDHTALKVKKEGRDFRTYMHGNITIFQYIKGMSPITIYTMRPDLRSRDMTQTFYPYQKFIAEVKSDVLQRTGISIEEWVMLSKVTQKYKIVGGFTWKLFEMKKYEADKFITKRSINFDEI
jgi:hypothetical protein